MKQLSRESTGPVEDRSAAGGRDRQEGMTLVEVMVSILIIGLLAGVIVRSLIISRQITQAAAQRVAAFSLCEARMEEARAFDYSAIVSSNLAAEVGLPFSRVGEGYGQVLSCNRSVAIQPLTLPQRKELVITVSWSFRGKQLQETLTGIMYPR